ncbi:unnamed protein product [Cercospora beticola]|nr:unnamed protein product [Cercospora beticola]
MVLPSKMHNASGINLTNKMAKRKRNNAQANAASKKQAAGTGIRTPPYETSAEPTSASAVVPPEDLEITVETLQALTEHPSVIKSKTCKDLRTAVFNFRQACTTGQNAVEGNSLTARISAALSDAKYTDAMVLLAEMRIRKETPSLGALCRWVRVLDVISGLAIHVEPSTKTVAGFSPRDQELRQVLDAVLRVTGPTDPTALGAAAEPGTIALQATWDLRQAQKPTRSTRASVEDKSIFKSCPPNLKDNFRIIETTPGPQRKPPNLHPAVLFASQNDTVPLRNGPKTTVHKHPVVPNLRLIKDVLSPEECSSIIAAGETMEFIPDAPIRQDEDTSILAHNFYWIVDQAFHDKLWERVRPFVPESVTGRQVRGINRRFRVYRYVPGAEYRCHIGEYHANQRVTGSPTNNVLRRSMAAIRHRSSHRCLPIRRFTCRCTAVISVYLFDLPQRRLQRRRDYIFHTQRARGCDECVPCETNHGQRGSLSARRGSGRTASRRHGRSGGRQIRYSN